VKRRPDESYEAEQGDVTHSQLNRAMAEIEKIEKRERRHLTTKRNRIE